MKAQSLWAGHDYAFIPSRGRGQEYSNAVLRVKVIRMFKRKEYYKKNETTYVDVQVLNWDGTAKESETREIRAYDVVNFWDEFEGEHKELLDGYLERVKQQELDRLEKQRIAELEAERRREFNESFNAKLRNKGLNPDNVIVEYTKEYITIHKKELYRWLEIEEKT